MFNSMRERERERERERRCLNYIIERVFGDGIITGAWALEYLTHKIQ